MHEYHARDRNGCELALSTAVQLRKRVKNYEKFFYETNNC